MGRPKHPRVMAGAVEGDLFIGRKAQELRGLLKVRQSSSTCHCWGRSNWFLQIKYPMEHGIVTDWDDMERIWSFVYTEELRTLSEEACRVFMAIRHPRLMTHI